MPRHKQWGSSLTPEEKDLFLRVACRLSGARNLDELLAVEALRKSERKQARRAARNQLPPNNPSPEHPTKRQRTVNVANVAPAQQALQHHAPQALSPGPFHDGNAQANASVRVPPSWYPQQYGTQIHLDKYDNMRGDGIAPSDSHRNMANIEDLERRRVLGKAPMHPHGVSPVRVPSSWYPQPYGTQLHHDKYDSMRGDGIAPSDSHRNMANIEDLERRRVLGKAPMHPHGVSPVRVPSSWYPQPYGAQLHHDKYDNMRGDGIAPSDSHRNMANIEDMERRVLGKAPIHPHGVSSIHEQVTPWGHGNTLMNPPQVFNMGEQDRRTYGHTLVSPHGMSSGHRTPSGKEQERKRAHGKAPMSPP